LKVRNLIATAMAFAATGCSSLPMVDLPSTNQNSRIYYLVIHFTSEHFAESVRLLATRTERPVSVHYLVPEPGDETYDRRRLVVHRLVPESRRAYHAGQSYWAGATYLNNSSIGIEIVNQSRCVYDDPPPEELTPEAQRCTLLDFPEEQLELVIALAKDIVERNPDIDPVNVVGHADIAPTRRVDPGPLFPWKRLYEAGVGAWYDDDTMIRYRQLFSTGMPSIYEVQQQLAKYGYQVEATGELDTQTRFVLRAFQMHYRPENVSLTVDAETASILYALVEKYRPDP